ncbi:MAG: hypothetical protein Q4F75_06945 [Pseudomonadota bacterium]|nr:hypothetical protein [Pseudomonadota bacterium]
MNINSKFLLLGTSLSLIPNLLYAQCSPAQSCAELGYKETSNKGGCLKCPFGNGWYCPEPKEEKAVLGQCTGYAKNCKIGQILNNDGTCTNDVTAGKTPIAVVVYISNEGCGQAITAKSIAQEIYWGEAGVDIPELENHEDINDYDSCQNTKKIIYAGWDYPAARAAKNYVPDNAAATKDKWCLPAVGVLASLSQNLNAVNAGIYKLGGTQIREYIDGEEFLWSSTEGEAWTAWAYWPSGGASGIGLVLNGKDGKRGTGNASDGVFAVRPVIEF